MEDYLHDHVYKFLVGEAKALGVLGPLYTWPVESRGQTPNSSPKVKTEVH